MSSDNPLKIVLGRPAVKLRAKSSKACPITVKEQHKKNNPSQQKKYSNLKPAEMRKILKPFCIAGTSGMRKDELTQLCLLYDLELNGEWLPTSPISNQNQIIILILIMFLFCTAATKISHTVVRHTRSRSSMVSEHAEPCVPNGPEVLSSTPTTNNLSDMDKITEGEPFNCDIPV